MLSHRVIVARDDARESSASGGAKEIVLNTVATVCLQSAFSPDLSCARRAQDAMWQRRHHPVATFLVVVRPRAPHRNALRTGPHASPHRDDDFFPLHRRGRRRACRAVAPLGGALGVSSIAHHQMCGARAAIGLDGAARDPPRVRRGRRAPRRRPRVVLRGGTRVRAPPARYVPRAKPRPDTRRARERSLIVHLGRDGRASAFVFRSPSRRAATARRRAASLAPIFDD